MQRFFLILLLLPAFIGVHAADYVVAADGSGHFKTVQEAVDACPDNVRSFIYIKKGTYYGQTSIGTKAVSSSKIISLIGENRDSVILTYDKSLNNVSTFELATTFLVYAKNFYAENVTFENAAGNTGQALALYNAADMYILKNCYLKGYQDTYRTKKGTRGYLYNCLVEGAVDFIYAGGTVFFDDCIINCIKSGGYVTAPEDAYATVPKATTETGIFIRLGFIFRNCQIKGSESVPVNSFFLGRPWGDYAGSIYLNCKLSNQVHTAGWSVMGSTTYTTACFAEYNSMDVSGNPINVSGRVSWSYQLKKSDVDNYLTTTAVYAKSYTSVFDPLKDIAPVNAPANLKLTTTTLTWEPVSQVSGYIIYSHGNFAGFTGTNSYDFTSVVPDDVSVRAMNQIGVLSEAAKLQSAINVPLENTISFTNIENKIQLSENADIVIYDTKGLTLLDVKDVKEMPVSSLEKGLYLLLATGKNGNILRTKFIR